MRQILRVLMVVVVVVVVVQVPSREYAPAFRLDV
jgi:hypothetical protein